MAKKPYIPKGKTIASKGVRPDFLSKEQAERYQRNRRNYNQRIYRAESKLAKRLGTTRTSIRRTGYTGIPNAISLTEIKSKAQYEALLKLMRTQKTKKFKRETQAKFKSTLFDILDSAFAPPPDLRMWIRDTIRGMTPEEIIEFRIDNKNLVRDFFYTYDQAKESMYDKPEMERQWRDLTEALSEYTAMPIPGIDYVAPATRVK